MADSVLDAQGLLCPLPILRAKKVLRTLAPGDTLTVLATDPSSVRDFQSFCEQTGDTLVEWVETSPNTFRYCIRKH